MHWFMSALIKVLELKETILVKWESSVKVIFILKRLFGAYNMKAVDNNV